MQGVDTRLKALQPGTTLGDLAYSSATANTNTRLGIGTAGQVLAVSGGVPAWTTTADVTPLTTKGDLFTFTTVDARIGVGANNTVLTADSAEATGLKWATPAGSTFVGARCLLVAQISAVANNTRQVINWTAEDYDTDSIHSLVTNTSRLTVPTGKGGYWGISSTALWQSSTSGYRQMFIYKNGSAIAVVTNSAGAGDFGLSLWNGVVSLAAADYIEIYVLQNTGGTRDLYGNNSDTGVTAVNFYYLGA